MEDLKNKPDRYWREKLTPEQYRVLREKGTEAPFTGDFVSDHGEGMYRCAACGQELFISDAKFDSGTGWPSFYEAMDPAKVELHNDTSAGMSRTEAICARCGSHLGHVFPDGPKPTGERYCMNSVSLKFEAKKSAKES